MFVECQNVLGFSELMERVNVADSGRFNYHLTKVVGTFVKKSDDGYALRGPGQLLYEALVAGTLTDRQSIEPFSVDDCPDCNGKLSVAYHSDHLITVKCVDCDPLIDLIRSRHAD